jgi:uncharacterized membrane protein
MPFLALIAVVGLLAIPVCVILLMVGASRMRRRVEALERSLTDVTRRIDSLTVGEASGPATPISAAPPTAVVDRAVDQAQSPLPMPVTPGRKDDETAAGPWQAAEGRAAAPLPPSRQDRPIVMRADRLAELQKWLVQNWVYAVSALSLALAGIFFVQYGVERGLLPPVARVTMAVLFGFALIGAGEWIRRRHGDGPKVATAFLPSTFSGAGLVSIFAGVLAARQLYGLIGPEAAFAGLLATAALAVVLGWFYGPMLAAVGLLGAAAAPFVVGGDSDAPYWLYGYYGVLAGAGLAVDAVRRWAWVSVLALALGYCGGWLVLVGTGGAGWWAMLLVGLALMAIAVPVGRLVPDHGGPTIAGVLLRRGKGAWPEFPVRLAGGAVALSALGLAMLPSVNGSESMLAYLCLTVLGLALILWADRALALTDLAALPALAFLARLGAEGLGGGPLVRDFFAKAPELRAPESAPPLTVSVLLFMAVLLTLAAAGRSLRGPSHRNFWALGATLTAPLAALVLELFWVPSIVIGTYPWALQVVVLAALMTGLAVRYARADGTDRRRAAYATLSALSLIALALFLLTTKGALTLALAALVVVAAALDRRYRLPEMALFIQAGIMVLSWRLVVDPGLGWAIDGAALWEVLAAYGGAVAAMFAGMRLLDGLDRRAAGVFLESALAGFAALFANVLITRWLDPVTSDRFIAHWALSLNALPWLILMLVQLYRLQLGGLLRYVRWVIAAVGGVLALGGMAAAVGPANPLLDWTGLASRRIYGPPVIDTLLVAYALPAVIILAALTRMGHLTRWLKLLLGGVGVALLTLYGALEIRRLWRGTDISLPGVTQPELYSYTLAMMAVGAALLYQAIARRSGGLRRVAMGVIALTVAKVFLIDASGLSGLTRVFSFLALGLSLAGLAWLNRWAAGQQDGEAAKRG